jgi:hypothetical protein
MATITHQTRSTVAESERRSSWLGQLLWLLAAAVVGFGISALFSSVLGLPRPWFLAAYLAIVSGFLYGYVRSSGLDPGQLLRRSWLRGLIGAVLLGAIMAWSMQRQPASPPPDGVGLLVALGWLGLVYGLLDSLLLNVMPVVAARRMFEQLGRTGSLPGRVAAGPAGLLASLVVTATYHLGFAEFRGSGLVAPLLGNGVMTLGYLLAGNPITAIVAHVVLHVASVLHGVDTTVTLPPHY